jgi:hypothetical protein
MNLLLQQMIVQSDQRLQTERREIERLHAVARAARTRPEMRSMRRLRALAGGGLIRVGTCVRGQLVNAPSFARPVS